MKSLQQIALALSVFVLSLNVHAAFSRKGQTADELQNALAINLQLLTQWDYSLPVPAGQPVLETDHFRYLLMNGDDQGDDEIIFMHKTFAQNLPADMILVVVTESHNVGKVTKQFLQWLPRDRFIVANGTNLGDLMWGRDSYPYPVYKEDGKSVELIAHQYFRRFTAQQIISDAVQAQSVSNEKFVYVGGNLTAAANGDCFAVNSDRTFGLQDAQFLSSFRCHTITRLPWLVGIGDVDEVVKVLANTNTILTNQASYVPIFQNMGYRVVMLPDIENSYRTYANSVILGTTVFMPSYNDPKDQQAAQVYQSQGYNVIMIPSSGLSDDMWGSLHCLTMAYPDVDLRNLFSSLNLKQAN